MAEKVHGVSVLLSFVENPNIKIDKGTAHEVLEAFEDATREENEPLWQFHSLRPPLQMKALEIVKDASSLLGGPAPSNFLAVYKQTLSRLKKYSEEVRAARTKRGLQKARKRMRRPGKL